MCLIRRGRRSTRESAWARTWWVDWVRRGAKELARCEEGGKLDAWGAGMDEWG